VRILAVTGRSNDSDLLASDAAYTCAAVCLLPANSRAVASMLSDARAFSSG
jgi:hypothetical protein